MHLLYAFFIVLIALGHAKADQRIVGGAKARVGQFPWQAAIYVDTDSGKFFCGGSLINPQWILSAAHCLYNGRLFTIHLGSLTLQTPDSGRLTLLTSSSFLFPNFDPLSLEHDIGLLKLHMPVALTEYIQPIPLAQIGDTIEGQSATTSGWGQINDVNAGIVNDLYYTIVAVISNEECRLTYGDQVKSTMICAVGNYNEGICLGDTGGPLVINKGINQVSLIGIAGFYSQEGCETVHPSGYIRVDIYNSWIQDTIKSI